MLRVPEDPRRGPRLDDLAALHDRQLVAERLQHLEVVADEYVAQDVLGLKLLQELDDLELDGPVERGGRLVEDEEGGPQDEGPRYGDALPLAARVLVGIAHAAAPDRGRRRASCRG